MVNTKKPSISTEAKQRIRSFVHEVEALQERWGVRIAGTDIIGNISLVDANRQHQWNGPDGLLYAEHDATVNVRGDGDHNFTLANLEIEDFDGWGK